MCGPIVIRRAGVVWPRKARGPAPGQGLLPWPTAVVVDLVVAMDWLLSCHLLFPCPNKKVNFILSFIFNLFFFPKLSKYKGCCFTVCTCYQRSLRICRNKWFDENVYVWDRCKQCLSWCGLVLMCARVFSLDKWSRCHCLFILLYSDMFFLIYFTYLFIHLFVSVFALEYYSGNNTSNDNDKRERLRSAILLNGSDDDDYDDFEDKVCCYDSELYND